MHMMGGALAIDSSDSGSTICFSMNFRIPEDAKKSDVKRVRPEESGRRNLSILLAEDDPVNMFAAQRILAKAGHAVTPASDGGQALELLRGAEFDLILMDVQMPVMDGLEATAAIRADKTIGDKSRIPIVAMTAYAMSGDQERFLAGGMDGYIAKPLDSTTLHETIFRVVSRKNEKQKALGVDVLTGSDARATDPTEA
jgi:CheY-like chemotaxis protein